MPAYRRSEACRRDGGEQAHERARIDALILCRNGLDLACAAQLELEADTALSVQSSVEPARKAMMECRPQPGHHEIGILRLSTVPRLRRSFRERGQDVRRGTRSTFHAGRLCQCFGRAHRARLALPGVHVRVARSDRRVRIFHPRFAGRRAQSCAACFRSPHEARRRPRSAAANARPGVDSRRR